MASSAPGDISRPSTISTSGRKRVTFASTPRMATFERPSGFPIGGSETIMVTSPVPSGWPSAAFLTPGEDRITPTFAWSMLEESSLSLPFRMTTAVSRPPLRPMVSFTPAPSISVLASTNTTSAMPMTVAAVVGPRLAMLRRL